MGIVNLGQVAAIIKSVEVEALPGGAAPTVRNAGTKANAELVFGIPDTRNMIINILKNGYIQWPGMPSPLEDTSLHFEGYSWYEVHYRGNFFRAKGENAKAFSSKKLTKEQIKNGNYIFQDDEQGDAVRNIEGFVDFDSGNVILRHSQLFTATDQEIERSWDTGIKPNSKWPRQKLTFKTDRVVPTAEENRSRNLTFTIWVLVKD